MNPENAELNLDISSDQLDLRFTLSLSDQTIHEQGRDLLTSKRVGETNDWLENLDRNKLVSFSIKCLKRIMVDLDLSEEEIRSIMKKRNIENKRISTRHNRRRVAFKELEKLNEVRKRLQDEKLNLQNEIQMYQSLVLNKGLSTIS